MTSDLEDELARRASSVRRHMIDRTIGPLVVAIRNRHTQSASCPRGRCAASDPVAPVIGRSGRNDTPSRSRCVVRRLGATSRRRGCRPSRRGPRRRRSPCRTWISRCAHPGRRWRDRPGRPAMRNDMPNGTGTPIALRNVLPIHEKAPPRAPTANASDPDSSFPPIEEVRPPAATQRADHPARRHRFRCLGDVRRGDRHAALRPARRRRPPGSPSGSRSTASTSTRTRGSRSTAPSTTPMQPRSTRPSTSRSSSTAGSTTGAGRRSPSTASRGRPRCPGRRSPRTCGSGDDLDHTQVGFTETIEWVEIDIGAAGEAEQLDIPAEMQYRIAMPPVRRPNQPREQRRLWLVVTATHP